MNKVNHIALSWMAMEGGVKNREKVETLGILKV